MKTFNDILQLWSKTTFLSEDIKVPCNAIYQWKFRDSIPADKWEALAEAAKKRGYIGVTIEKLAEIAARKKRKKKNGGNA